MIEDETFPQALGKRRRPYERIITDAGGITGWSTKRCAAVCRQVQSDFEQVGRDIIGQDIVELTVIARRGRQRAVGGVPGIGKHV
ncbi:MAG: hypothetical protein ACLS7Z_03755 [Christensenellales bacterium]